MNPAMQAQYRNMTYQQSMQRSAHPSQQQRRAAGPMMVNNSAQMAAAHQQQTEKKDKDDREAAKRRAKKPTDKNIPEGVENIIIGEGVQQYRSMREMERKLDAIMMRKRLDFQDARAQTSERTGRLRVWISNTVENQPWQGKDLDENAFDFNSGMEPTYKVKIEGRLLDDSELDGIADDDEDDGGGCTNEQLELGTVAMERDGQGATAKKLRASVLPRRKLSWFFKSITVEYDRTKTLQPDGTTSIEWKKPPVSPGSVELPATSDFDSLEFERKSDENINCTISFYRDESPERHALSKDLADLVDMEEGTREAIVTGIWEYIKALGLQQDEEKRIIQCDDRLRAIFNGADNVFFPQMAELITPHLSPLPPIQLPYTIRVDPDYQASPVPTIYDIIVPAENVVRAKVLTVTQNPPYLTTLRQISNLDDQLGLLVQAINNSKAKHSFLTGMGKDPGNFIRKWTSSQKWDLDIIVGDAIRGGGDVVEDEFRRGGKDGVWGTDNVRESVGLMVAKKR